MMEFKIVSFICIVKIEAVLCDNENSREKKH